MYFVLPPLHTFAIRLLKFYGILVVVAFTRNKFVMLLENIARGGTHV